MIIIRKFYDTLLGCSGGEFDDPVAHEENIEDKEIIECECGTHLLQIISDSDIYTVKSGKKVVHQTFYLAMFNHGNQKKSFWEKLKIAWGYLRTGKTFTDQLCMNPKEAKKLADFININLIETVENDGK